MYWKDRTENGGELLLDVNENVPGEIINTYKFKEILKQFYLNLAYQIKRGQYWVIINLDLEMISHLLMN